MQERKDWLELQQKHKKDKPVAKDRRTERMATLLAGKLENHTHWNDFRKYAASNIARLELIVESFKIPLLSHVDVDAETIMRAKIGLHAHQAALEVYRDMLAYPDTIKNLETDIQK